ncbi:hypothetical protein BOTBODRAFT_46757 [Botryobasidium botryosum FD-172 SS1]|uniref:C2H2-type domain-containing protein n=1 Tax=Botryobasidium botryosum (strain FD-172 SS1) TaxID=930990 RepID=A0A067MG79_BOTB1|nr:hypothetical protein BOTBODRAFT_46757 [Botryobasidium botryosum FD-172 SS1]
MKRIVGLDLPIPEQKATGAWIHVSIGSEDVEYTGILCRCLRFERTPKSAPQTFPIHDLSLEPTLQSLLNRLGVEPTSQGHPPAAGANPPPRGGKYACVGCNSIFERPSALKQHMMSHTGEKPAQRPAAPYRGATTRSTPSESSSSSSRRSAARSSSSATASSKASRKRSAPRWVPASLTFLVNATLLSSTPPFTDPNRVSNVVLPLPPVRPRGSPHDDVWEERNSFEELSQNPYHPSQWRGLPGPGLLKADELAKHATVARRWIFM